MSIKVTVSNFARAESEHMFRNIVGQAGGTNLWSHGYTPTEIDQQPIIRMNRDTLYSAAIIDISQDATVVLPDAGDRYMSMMVVSAEHYIPVVFHGGGRHELKRDEIGTDFVLIAVRTLVDPEDSADVKIVNDLQNAMEIHSVGGQEFVLPEYDAASYKATRDAILVLSAGLPNLNNAFGKQGEVEPVRHLLGTAYGWGGLPDAEARYLNIDPGLPVGEYELTVRDVPVDGFWSISLYNAEGFFQENPEGLYSVNSVTGTQNEDGSYTVRFGGDTSLPNTLPIMDGWNYIVRLYQPRPEILDGSWVFPSINQ